MPDGTCVVIHTGFGADGSIVVRLRDYKDPGMLQGKWRFFVAPETKQREMLAMALVAMSSGYPVWAYVDKIDDVPPGNISGTLLALQVIHPSIL